MLFNSIEFVIFFIIVTSAYFLLEHKYRWFLLLMASCYFYMAFVPIYILILGFTIVIDYYAGILIENASGARRKWWLVMSLVANIGVLAVFKYYNFLNDNLGFLLGQLGKENPVPYLTILLPIGLSFHTFQAMSYTIEVYRGHHKAERNFGIYALYVMFYPQLVAGPIERPQNILWQFYVKHEFEINRVVSGLKLMLWGFFKKLVVADRLAIYVNSAYNFPENHSGLTLIIATVFFAFQIYCDFSGYSDIAIGSARVMGFDLMKNFNRPYFASSISEFWKRWHISLSTWFRDYLYISLGGNRVALPRVYFNLFFTFLISGLWHGANWTYVIWGGLNGIYLVAALVRDRVLDKLNLKSAVKLPAFIMKPINIGFTFVLICFSWVFFRARNLSEAVTIIKKMFTLEGPVYTSNPTMFFCLLSILMLLLVETKQEYFSKAFSLMENRNPVIRYSTYLAIILLILLMGVFDGSQFIYFQF
ncbi:MBOAT family protein [Flavihumibacter rivuli]|uniref:MBOAT family O-acyltransferase n=1 Tax=Flavihumibacter rivuli TaxID=2838156 RepID=UPI001BDE47CB|nr:MBOAT family O-acyltransferase [Flavihumibacter rivuli]ULQ57948.1 MBOAT family protein [Flavihumibacter rivuli]